MLRPSRPSPKLVAALAAATALAALSCGGGGDGGGTAPPTVASVEIGGAAVPAVFQTLGRTVQLAATARDAAGAAIPGAAITWLSSNTGVATVSGTGLVTAAGNGSAQVTAASGGKTSAARTVTVSQVAASIGVTPAAVAFGAIGSTRQLVATVVDSSGAAVAGAAAPAWTRAGTGATASVSAGGLVTALAVGVSDTAVASATGLADARVPISVTQVVATITVTPSTTDTLRTTTRTRQYAGVPKDSMGNTIGSATVSWSSSSTGVATVGAGTGLATAVADGSTSIIATSGSITAQRTLVVRRYAATFQLTPGSASISTASGTQVFTGSAQDSVATNLPISWASRTSGVATVSPSSGTSTTATAVGNGSSYIVMSAGTRADSALLSVSGQATAPLTAGVTVGDFFFRSTRNNSQNLAVDTIAVGGMVTWTWATSTTHTVTSDGSPSFSSSGNLNGGVYQIIFNSVGSYNYSCSIHPAMTGRVVVR
jgi:plastocyanin